MTPIASSSSSASALPLRNLRRWIPFSLAEGLERTYTACGLDNISVDPSERWWSSWSTRGWLRTLCRKSHTTRHPIADGGLDANDEGNIVLLSRLEAWYGLHPLLQTGPVLWREDRLIDAKSRQYLGLGVRTELVAGPIALRPALRAGWGPGSAGWGIWGDIALGSPSRR